MNETIKTREEIMDELAEAIKAEAETEYEMECEVEYRKIKKNNGLMLQAVLLQEPNAIIHPTIYIDTYLKALIAGDAAIDDVADTIVRMHMENRDNNNVFNVVKNMDKKAVLENVVYQLVNSENNKERLSETPHTEFLDLAVIYRVEIDTKTKSSFIVTDAICKHYHVTVEELDAAARKNTEQKGFSIKTIEEIISEITGMPMGGQGEYPTWVITNHEKLNGAIAMLYPDIFSKLAKEAQSDLYILPSSIHEVLAMPVDNAEPKELRDMVGAINVDEVAEDEVLSGNIYRYNMAENRIVIAE